MFLMASLRETQRNIFVTFIIFTVACFMKCNGYPKKKYIHRTQILSTMYERKTYKYRIF